MKKDEPTLESLTASVAKFTEDLEAQSTRAEAAEAKVAELETRLKGEPDPDPLAKVKDPAVRELVAKAQAKADKAEADAAESREAVRKMADAQQRNVFIKKAADLKAYGPADDLGPVLQKIAKALDDKEYEKFAERLRAVQAQVDLGQVLKEFGDGGEAAGGTADQKLDSIAKGYVQDGKFRKYAEAYEEAMLRNPDLAEQALEEG